MGKRIAGLPQGLRSRCRWRDLASRFHPSDCSAERTCRRGRSPLSGVWDATPTSCAQGDGGGRANNRPCPKVFRISTQVADRPSRQVSVTCFQTDCCVWLQHAEKRFLIAPVGNARRRFPRNSQRIVSEHRGHALGAWRWPFCFSFCWRSRLGWAPLEVGGSEP